MKKMKEGEYDFDRLVLGILTAVLSASHLFWSLPAWAQERPRQPTPEQEAAACAACGGAFGVIIFLIVATFALNIALLVWVARDAKSRGMDSAVLWMILVMLTSVIGLVIYIFSRPQGQLIQCPHCNNKRLAASAKCPHCGNS